METNDHDLLRQYAERHSQEAFAALVSRHVNLVYSVALRRVQSPHLAEEVSQSVFTDLARNADKLRPDTVLGAWLHSVAYRTAIDVVRGESRRQAREQKAMEIAAMDSMPSDWSLIEGLLDEGMDTLEETDRSAIVLRYFENKSLREVGETLGTSDDAAQKRVSRAVERLREFFAKRGVTVGASGLIVVISANAVQAAPAGLAAAISSAAAIAGTAAAVTTTTTTATVTKAIAMTTLQKTLIVATIAVTAGAGFYEAHQASTLREQVQTFQEQIQTLQQQQAPLTEQLQQLQRERDNAKKQLAAVQGENEQWKSGQKMTGLSGSSGSAGEAGMLSQPSSSNGSEANSSAAGLTRMMSDPKMKDYIHQVQLKMIKERYAPLFTELALSPDDVEKFTQLVGDKWLKASDMGSKLVSGNADPAAMPQAMAKAYDENNDQLQSLLGPTGYARYNEFNQEVPARTTIKMLNDQLGNSPLTEDQNARLIDIVKAEPYTTTHGINGELDAAFFGSQDDIDKYLKQVTETNQRILDQAAGFLTPQQLAALATLQSNSLKAQKLQGAALTQKH